MATGGFSFPVASLPEVISVVHEWGLDDVQQSQIAACDPTVIQRIYAVAVQRVTGISLETLDYKTEQLVSGLDEYGVITILHAITSV
jgi:Nuf2 family